MRSFYTKSKEEFDALLESLEESADRTVTAMVGILTVVTDPVLPELVVQRLTGENPSGKPKDIRDYMVSENLKELAKLPISQGVLSHFSLDVSCAGDELSIMRSAITSIRLRLPW